MFWFSFTMTSKLFCANSILLMTLNILFSTSLRSQRRILATVGGLHQGLHPRVLWRPSVVLGVLGSYGDEGQRPVSQGRWAVLATPTCLWESRVNRKRRVCWLQEEASRQSLSRTFPRRFPARSCERVGGRLPLLFRAVSFFLYQPVFPIAGCSLTRKKMNCVSLEWQVFFMLF